jgi:hypothetical protein
MFQDQQEVAIHVPLVIYVLLQVQPTQQLVLWVTILQMAQQFV